MEIIEAIKARFTMELTYPHYGRSIQCPLGCNCGLLHEQFIEDSIARVRENQGRNRQQGEIDSGHGIARPHGIFQHYGEGQGNSSGRTRRLDTRNRNAEASSATARPLGGPSMRAAEPARIYNEPLYKERRDFERSDRNKYVQRSAELNPNRRTLGDGTVSVLFGPGYSITEITPIVSTATSVLLGKLPPSTPVSMVRLIVADATGIRVLDQFIRLEDAEDGWNATIRFREAYEAQKAASELDGYIYQTISLTCSVIGANFDDSDTVKIFCNWFLPSKLAIMNFSSSFEATEAALRAPKVRNLQPKYKVMSPNVFRGNIQYSVQIIDLDVNTTENDLMQLFPSRQSFKLYPPRYNEPLYEVTAMIQSLFEKHSGVSINFEVLSKPEERRQRAMVTFHDSGIGEKLFNEMKDQKMPFLGGFALGMRIVFAAKIRVPAEIYQVIAWDVRRIVDSDSRVELRERGRDPYPRWLTVSGADRAAVATANLAIMKLSRGSVVCNDDGRTLWEPRLASPSGREAMSKAASAAEVHIRCDARTRTIRVFGSPAKCLSAREPLLKAYQAYLDTLLLPVVMSFSHSVSREVRAERVNKLRKMHGADKVDFVYGANTVTVRCTGTDIPKVCRIIGGSEPSSAGAGDCVVCLCEAEDPVQTTCNHLYCQSCLRDSIISVVESRGFPIRCHGTNPGGDTLCGQPLDIDLVQRMIKSDELDGLCDAALAGYVQSHPDELYYCPTPDCTSIFAVTTASPREASKTRTCTQCLVSSCRSCRTPSHPTQSCEENLMTVDEKNAVWKKKHGIKPCPKCGIDVEKIEGCDHMTCRCGCHFCWICGKERDVVTVYAHIAECTGPKVVDGAQTGIANALQREREMAEEQARELRRIEQEMLTRAAYAEQERLRRDEENRRFFAEQDGLRQAELQVLRRAEEQSADWGCTVM